VVSAVAKAGSRVPLQRFVLCVVVVLWWCVRLSRQHLLRRALFTLAAFLPA
jgi:hypothetical protein